MTLPMELEHDSGMEECLESSPKKLLAAAYGKGEMSCSLANIWPANVRGAMFGYWPGTARIEARLAASR